MRLPPLVNIFREYNWNIFTKDVTAGLIVGIVALPLAIAFGVASGVSPVNGIYATVIAGFIIAVFSGSRVQIGGPTGACIVIVYGIVQQFGIEGLIIATFLAGIMLILMGILRLGRIIRLIPDPLTEGFTAGISVDLFCSQFKDFFGIKMGSLPVDFIEKCESYVTHYKEFSYYALIIGVITIVINQTAPYFLTKKIPGPLISIATATLIAYFFHFPVETIGSKFGPVVATFPKIVMPHFSFQIIASLIRPAFAIALLVGILSLISGIVAERVVAHPFRSNKELVAEGIANLFSSVFGGIPVTGSIARTMTNVDNGGRTPVAGVAQSLTLLVILLLVGKWISFIPVAAIAGLLIVVAYNMSKWESFFLILNSRAGDAVLLLITFFITIFIDLTVAIEAGLIYSAFQFMHRMALVSNVKELTSNFFGDNGLYIEEQMMKYELPKGVAVFEINGPLFFAVSYKFKESFNALRVKPKIVIIRMRNVPIVDSTGIRTILHVAKNLKLQRIHIIIAEYKYNAVEEKLSDLLVSKIGKENVHGTLKEAIERSYEISGEQKDNK